MKYGEPSLKGNAETCFKMDEKLVNDLNRFIFQVDLGETFFVHAFLLVQGEGDLEKFGNYKIYIGDNSVYGNNAKCPGGPFMKPTDAANVDKNGNWKLGKELWCNLPGRYITVSADLSHLTKGTSDYGMTICSLGIMGTKYELPSGTSIPTKITMVDKEQKIVNIPRIVSSLTIGNTLKISLAQG